MVFSRMLIAGLIVVLLLTGSAAVRGAVVDVTLDTGHSGFQLEGDDTLWVDLSYTAGMTYTQAETWAASWEFVLASREEIAPLFEALVSDGYLGLNEKGPMGGFVVSGYCSARGFFDDGTPNATAGVADLTYQTWTVDDDARAVSYADSRFGAFMHQIPEPTTGALLAVAALGLRRRRAAAG